MPIRLNLLAEAQAAEELRRRDPVKRAMWLGGFLVSLMLVWSLYLQALSMLASGDLRKVEAQMSANNTEFQAVQENKKKLKETREKLQKLSDLTNNRLLNGTVLNALQQTVVDDVKLVRIRCEQAYVLAEETKPKTNGNKVTPSKPATVTEKIVTLLEAHDSSPNPGDQINRFKDTVANHPYFQAVIGKTNEIKLSPPSPPVTPPDGPPFVNFSLEIRYPEKAR